MDILQQLHETEALTPAVYVSGHAGVRLRISLSEKYPPTPSL